MSKKFLRTSKKHFGISNKCFRMSKKLLRISTKILGNMRHLKKTKNFKKNEVLKKTAKLTNNKNYLTKLFSNDFSECIANVAENLRKWSER